MPSDANGVHSLPNGYHAEDGETIQPSQHNPPLEDLSAGLTDRLMRSGVAPMTGPLKLADGNSSSPGFAFNSDPGAGFYLENGKIKATRPIVQKELVGLGPLPWSRMTAPPGWVLCYGQTLLRASYPDLWLVAQAEIAAGNPLYNNGDGANTFGILDMRGRVAAGYDVMGGAAGNRLPGAFGVGQGLNGYALSEVQLPFLTKGLAGNSVTLSVTSDVNSWVFGSVTQTGLNNGIFQIQHLAGAASGVVSSYGSYTPTGSVSFGGGAVHPIVQPTIPTNAILYTGV